MNKENLKEKINQEISTGEIDMKPKWHFLFKNCLIILGVFISLLILLFLGSLILFALKHSGVIHISSMGIKGMFILITSMPWILILLAVLFIFILEVLVKNYSFAYRKPILVSLVSIVLIVFVGGFFLTKVHFHNYISIYSNEHKIPVAGSVYKNIQAPRRNNLHRGFVLEVKEDNKELIIFTRTNGTTTILITPKTRFIKRMNIEIKDSVVVIGKEVDGVIKAGGIKLLKNEIN